MDKDKLNKMLDGVEIDSRYGMRGHLPRIECVDGTSLSVQAGRTHYCSPRDNNGPWSKVEIGFPSITPSDAIMEYCEDSSDPTGTVYGYVPIELVCDFINDHGGIK